MGGYNFSDVYIKFPLLGVFCFLDHKLLMEETDCPIWFDYLLEKMLFHMKYFLDRQEWEHCVKKVEMEKRHKMCETIFAAKNKELNNWYTCLKTLDERIEAHRNDLANILNAVVKVKMNNKSMKVTPSMVEEWIKSSSAFIQRRNDVMYCESQRTRLQVKCDILHRKVSNLGVVLLAWDANSTEHEYLKNLDELQQELETFAVDSDTHDKEYQLDVGLKNVNEVLRHQESMSVGVLTEDEDEYNKNRIVRDILSQFKFEFLPSQDLSIGSDILEKC